MFKNLMIYTFGVIICFGSWQPSTVEQFYAPLVLVIVGTNAAAGLCVSLVLKYCDSLVKGFSTSVSVILAMAVSSVLFGFQLTRPFAIGTAVVCCAFYLYFGRAPPSHAPAGTIMCDVGLSTLRRPVAPPSASAARRRLQQGAHREGRAARQRERNGAARVQLGPRGRSGRGREGGNTARGQVTASGVAGRRYADAQPSHGHAYTDRSCDPLPGTCCWRLLGPSRQS